MNTWGWHELATLFLHFVSLSLMSIGGAVTTVPEMHRFLVSEQAWLSEGQFSNAIALAQAAPGPNVLFVADNQNFKLRAVNLATSEVVTVATVTSTFAFLVTPASFSPSYSRFTRPLLGGLGRTPWGSTPV